MSKSRLTWSGLRCPGDVPALRGRVYWQGIGWCAVATIVWLSLTPNPPAPPEFLAWDKAQHALAYAFLMYWFRQAFRRVWYWPVFLVGLGIGVEFLQGWGGVRQFDAGDMLANSVGVVAGYLAAATVLGGLVAALDRRLFAGG